MILFIFLNAVYLQEDRVFILTSSVEGNTRLSEDDIIRNSRLFSGTELTGDLIQKGIKRLYKLDRFKDIQVSVISEEAKGINILIYVEEYPMLDEINFSGNNKSSKTLKENISLKKGQILSDNDIADAILSLVSYYKSKHYHQVSIKYELGHGSIEGSNALNFMINEGEKLKLTKIIINGNEDISDFYFKRQLSETKEWKWFLPWRGTWDEDKLDKDIINITGYYNNNGYRDFYIKQKRLYLSDNSKSYTLELDVYEGPKYFYRNISWFGNTVFTNNELSAKLDVELGNKFNSESLDFSINEKVKPMYMDKGYFYLQLDPQEVPVGIDSLDLIFNITENDIVKIRKILISGNNRTDENVIRRELKSISL